jgi:hypothetical protein
MSGSKELTAWGAGRVHDKGPEKVSVRRSKASVGSKITSHVDERLPLGTV